MPTDAAEVLLAHMRARSHVAPKRLEAPGPNADALNLIFSAAAQAPDHGRIRPWRFIVVPQDKREALGHAFVQALQTRDAHASPAEMNIAYEKAFRAPCLVLAVLSHAPSEPQVPAHERLISLGAAIQNMVLMAQTLAIGSGITSGQSMNASSIRDLFKLDADETCICYVAFGHVSRHKPQRKRSEPTAFVSVLD
ncbi:nitroreductase family protein [Limnohabitans sp. INBF002]|uniref:nitroreductase family protein n=1 Tax=Limnohabitans sp. INBF002 TaxID=2986280 RepID=UPI00237794AF|nr:nitroreductase family protein [Limnohabitans sp. INBF002]BDU52671.1 nitroreductase [Limnohabitans sp. INBF002]